jgi:hypothetical protein
LLTESFCDLRGVEVVIVASDDPVDQIPGMLKEDKS